MMALKLQKASGPHLSVWSLNCSWPVFCIMGMLEWKGSSWALCRPLRLHQATKSQQDKLSFVLNMSKRKNGCWNWIGRLNLKWLINRWSHAQSDIGLSDSSFENFYSSVELWSCDNLLDQIQTSETLLKHNFHILIKQHLQWLWHHFQFLLLCLFCESMCNFSKNV